MEQVYYQMKFFGERKKLFQMEEVVKKNHGMKLFKIIVKIV